MSVLDVAARCHPEQRLDGEGSLIWSRAFLFCVKFERLRDPSLARHDVCEAGGEFYALSLFLLV
jgi:hypothetical protein